jgi:hypothetical protein
VCFEFKTPYFPYFNPKLQKPGYYREIIRKYVFLFGYNLKNLFSALFHCKKALKGIKTYFLPFFPIKARKGLK